MVGFSPALNADLVKKSPNRGLQQGLTPPMIMPKSSLPPELLPKDNEHKLIKDPNLDVEWKLNVSRKDVILTETVTNHFSHPIYFPPDPMPVGVVRKKDKFELHEIGMQFKRSPDTFADFIKLSPEQSHTFEYKLNEVYGFVQGCHDYQFHLYTGYFYPDDDTFVDLGMDAYDFSWCNTIDPYNGFLKKTGVE